MLRGKEKSPAEKKAETMTRFAYYQEMKALARSIRAKYGITCFRVLPNTLKQILKAEGVHYIDLRTLPKKVRGAYFYEPNNISVLIQKGLPRDPYAFTLAHELKHNLVDRGNGIQLFCTVMNINEHVEIGAEVFAAEFLFPEEDFMRELKSMLPEGKAINPKIVVTFKKKFDTTLSYQGIVKRLEYLQLIRKDEYKKIQWKKLEEEVFGVPYYKARGRKNSRDRTFL